MNVSLTHELEAWIETRVSSGLYRSSSEVVREALRVLREREELKELQRESLRQRILEGVADYEAGRTHTADDAFFNGILAEGRRTLAAKN